MADVAVVILNYNGQGYLHKFLGLVVKYSSNADIIVADNCSTDDSVNYIKDHHPNVGLILFDQNHGFTGGYNKAIAKIDHKYTVLLNSDIEVTPNWITPIIALMNSSDDISACQPKILSYHEKDKFEYAGAAGGFIDRLGYPYCRGRIFDEEELDEGQYDQTTEVFWATGAALFIKTQDYKDAGGLDERFFAHMEEIDLCWRLHHLNKKCYCVPESVVYHVGGGTLAKTNPQKTYLNFRNNLSMLFKNESLLNVIWKIPVRIPLDIISAIKFWKDNSIQHFYAVIKAHWHFFLQIPVLIKKRNTIIKLYPNTLPYPVASIIYTHFIRGIKRFQNF